MLFKQIYFDIIAAYISSSIIKAYPSIIEFYSSNIMFSTTINKKKQVSDHRKALELDADTVWRTFPGISKHYICEMLRPLQDNPARAQIVIYQLLMKGLDQDHFITSQFEIDDVADNDVPTRIKRQLDNNAVQRLIADASVLKAAFPSCDPHYIYDRLVTMAKNSHRIQALGNELVANPNYPTLKDKIVKQQQRARITFLMNMSLDLEQFLYKFPNPVLEFTDEGKVMSPSYQNHLRSFLAYSFPQLRTDFLETVMTKHNYRLTTSLATLAEEMKLYGDCKLQ